MNVLVTGASGYLGNVLCRLLVQQNYNVTAVALDATTARSLADLQIKKIDADITDADKIFSLLKDQEIVFHLASIIHIAKDANKYMHRVNVEGTKIVAEAALKNKIKRFIYVSSIHALTGHPRNEIINEQRELALSQWHFDYDRSKAEAELNLMEFVERGLNAVIINPTCFIGPYDFEPSLMGKAIKDIFMNKFSWILPGGFNYIDVRDVAETLINAITVGKAGERYILAGQWLTNDELADYIYTARHQKGIKIKLPFFVGYLLVRLWMSYCKLVNKKLSCSNQSLRHLKFHRYIDDSKARTILSHKSRPVAETLNDLKNWLWVRNRDVI